MALEISERVDQALLEQGVGIRRVHSVQDLFEVIQSDLRGGTKNPKNSPVTDRSVRVSDP